MHITTYATYAFSPTRFLLYLTLTDLFYNIIKYRISENMINYTAETNNKVPTMYFICELSKVTKYRRRAHCLILTKYAFLITYHNTHKYLTLVRLHL